MYKIIKSGKFGLLTWCSYNDWLISGFKDSWFFGQDFNKDEIYLRLFGLEITLLP